MVRAALSASATSVSEAVAQVPNMMIITFLHTYVLLRGLIQSPKPLSNQAREGQWRLDHLLGRCSVTNGQCEPSRVVLRQEVPGRSSTSVRSVLAGLLRYILGNLTCGEVVRLIAYQVNAHADHSA